MVGLGFVFTGYTVLGIQTHVIFVAKLFCTVFHAFSAKHEFGRGRVNDKFRFKILFHTQKAS